MPAESDRQAAYDRLRERFLAEPEFRAQFLADPTGTLESALGSLNEPEKAWVASLGEATGDDIVEHLKGRVGAW